MNLSRRLVIVAITLATSISLFASPARADDCSDEWCAETCIGAGAVSGYLLYCTGAPHAVCYCCQTWEECS